MKALGSVHPFIAFMGWTIGSEDGVPQTEMTQAGQGWDGGSQKGCLNLGDGGY